MQAQCIRRCLVCQTEFVPHPANVYRGKGFYCSRPCKYIGHSQKVTPIVERFWRHVEKTPACWLWTGALCRGHGQLYRGRDAEGKRRKIYAHRFSWELHRGPIPDGMEVCHNCPGGDNPACVNPDHLFLGSHAVNMADALGKDMLLLGERHHAAKLTGEKAAEIRLRYAAGGVSQTQLAREYGCSRGSIVQVLQRETWKRAH